MTRAKDSKPKRTLVGYRIFTIYKGLRVYYASWRISTVFSELAFLFSSRYKALVKAADLTRTSQILLNTLVGAKWKVCSVWKVQRKRKC